jgi:hypothetical protein
MERSTAHCYAVDLSIRPKHKKFPALTSSAGQPASVLILTARYTVQLEREGVAGSNLTGNEVVEGTE